MKKIFIVCAAFFCLSAIEAYAQNGQNLMLYGSSAAAMGRGGTGVAGYGPDLFEYNPATAAQLERISASVQYGDLANRYYNPDLTFILPSSYGVLGASFRMISMGDISALQSAYMATIGGAKDFTTHLALGAAVNMMYGDTGGSSFYLGMTLGALYHTAYEKEFGKGFGIYDPRFGLSVSAGVPMGTNRDYADMNKPVFGYTFGFFRNSFLSFSFYNEAAAIRGYSAFPVTFGMESTVKKNYIVRLGTSVPQEYEYGDFTMGLGYKFDHRYFTAGINYALVHYSSSTFVHYLGVTGEFGELDRQAPYTEIKSSELYISPNHDGTQDYQLIALNVTDRSKIRGWQLQIIDGTGNVVKEFKEPSRDVEQSLTFKGFFKKIIAKKESAVVPENVMWDGTDAAGTLAADGKYRYSFMAWDERDNYSEKKTGDIVVDKTSPAIELSNADVLFSPNGDGKKDEFIIAQKPVSSSDDEWSAGFADASGRVVRSYRWSGTSAPAQVKWDGKDNAGSDLPEGLYSYFVSSADKAGNAVKKNIAEITLTRKFETADVSVGREYFSYLKDESVNFKPSVSSREGMVSWQLVIEDEDGAPVKVIKADGLIPDRIEWKAADEKNEKISDGRYFYTLKTVYKSGNEPASFKKQIIVDSTPPKLDLEFTPELFSPDGDGNDDVLDLIPAVDEEFGLSDWNIEISYTGEKNKNIIFKQFSGKGDAPKEIRWDGMSDRGELVESATDYTMILSAADKAGNIAQSAKIVLPVDVLVVVTENGLKIRISNIEFEFDSAKINKRSYKILNRVGQLLDKYSRYRVRIEGHTDDIGDDTYNLKLSEQRANAVRDYLVLKGINKERLSILGRGETVPYISNKDEESRRKNRRVEFLLEKESK
ncbi:MAG: OmpA family protein [Spirochaetota bacterium]